MTTISEKIVAGLQAPETGNTLYYFSGAVLQGKRAPGGFAVRVTAAGTKSFVRFYRIAGKPHLKTLGRWSESPKGGDLSVLRALIVAQEDAKAVRDGKDPRPERTRRLEDGAKSPGEAVADMLDKYVARMRKDGGLRSIEEIARIFDRLVKPAIGRMGLYECRRKHIADMLDAVADENGPVMADRTLSYTRKAFHWRAIVDEDLTPPFIKGMARTNSKERARSRTLNDDEIRAIWKAADETDDRAFGALVKFLLLTGARRSEAARMIWTEFDGANWTLPAARNKVKVDLVRPLSKMALALLEAQPQAGPPVFSHVTGISWLKERLDKASGVTGWTLHDLRRTARSLMSRAGVNSDHAERCLGHVIGGVRGVYDRYEYHKEKKAAYETLASLIARILDPKANVEQIADRRPAPITA